MKFDLHMHTTRHSPDSFMDPFALVHRARQIGLEGVVITEHDWLWTEEELDELRAAGTFMAGKKPSSGTSSAPRKSSGCRSSEGAVPVILHRRSADRKYARASPATKRPR